MNSGKTCPGTGRRKLGHTSGPVVYHNAHFALKVIIPTNNATNKSLLTDPLTRSRSEGNPRRFLRETDVHRWPRLEDQSAPPLISPAGVVNLERVLPPCGEGLGTTAYKQDKSASGHLLTSRDPATSASTRSRPSPRALHAVYASTQPAPRSAPPSPLSRSPPFHTALHTHKRRQGDKVTQFKLRHRNKAELRKTKRREETPPPSTVASITKLRAGSRRRRLSNMYTKARSNFDTSQILAPESKRKRRNIIFRVLGKNPKMGFALQLILFNRRQNYSSIARPAPPGVQLELAPQLRIWPLACSP
jgi:hypothetical protein